MVKMFVFMFCVWEQCYGVILFIKLQFGQWLYLSEDVKCFVFLCVFVNQGYVIGVIVYVDSIEFQQLLDVLFVVEVLVFVLVIVVILFFVCGMLLVECVWCRKSMLVLFGIELVIELFGLDVEVQFELLLSIDVLIVEVVFLYLEMVEVLLVLVWWCGVSVVGVIYSFGMVCVIDMLCVVGVWLYWELNVYGEFDQVL